MANKVVVVSIDYGLDGSCAHLSFAGVTVLENAINFLNQDGGDVIAYCVADLRDKGMNPEDSALEKWKRLKRLAPSVGRVVVAARTSVDEAQNIKEALVKKGIEPRKIILFCDHWHAMRIRFIWGRVFPQSEIEVRPLHCRWGSNYACTYMRSELRWVLHNFVGLIAMKLFGVELLGSIKRP